eukprot:3491426-Prorocentrum_lima.AAC.1
MLQIEDAETAQDRNELIVNREGNATTISVERDVETGMLNVVSSMAKQEQAEGDTAPIALEDEYQDPEEEALPQSELINLDAEEDDDMSAPTIIP